jgi:4-hydroxythreonine-4-phosphate dehydrogenase
MVAKLIMGKKTRLTKPKIIGVTLGDPGGVGPEVVLKALPKYLKLQKKGIFFLVIGHLNALEKTSRMLKKKFSFNVLKVFDPKLLAKNQINVLPPSKERSFRVGKVDIENGRLSFEAIRLGTELAAQGKIQGLMTAPVNKESIQKTVKNFHGHTDYLAEKAGAKEHAMLLMGGPLRVVLITAHIPLSKVASSITSKLIVNKTLLANRVLKKQLGRTPRIGIAGLNPHSGEGGLLGKEEIRIISPAVKMLKNRKVNVKGPIPADTIFTLAYEGKLDLVVAMYHDQGLGPLKMIAFDKGINVTLGLSFKRSSPDHGTAFDIAYKNKANSHSTEKAIEYLLKGIGARG